METIKTWQERFEKECEGRDMFFNRRKAQEQAMQATIDELCQQNADLRTALSKQAESAPAGADAQSVACPFKTYYPVGDHEANASMQQAFCDDGDWLSKAEVLAYLGRADAQSGGEELRRAVQEMVRLLEQKEWPAAIISSDPDAQALEVEIASLVSALAQRAGSAEPIGYLRQSEIDKMGDPRVAGVGMMLHKEAGAGKVAVFTAPQPLPALTDDVRKLAESCQSLCALYYNTNCNPDGFQLQVDALAERARAILAATKGPESKEG